MSLADLVLRTPLLAYRPPDPRLAGRVFLKPENLQPFGSYKIRGVAAAIAAADPARLARGLVAASAGNMGQAVAFAAREIGAPCRVFVPDSAPAMKQQAIRDLGATVEAQPFSDIWAIVRGDVDPAGEAVFVHPTRSAALMTGYAAIAEEIVADLPAVEAVVVPYGLGGLALGVTRALERLAPEVAVYSVEPDTAAPMAASLAAGAPKPVERRSSFIDAIGTPEVLPAVFAELRGRLAGALMVDVAAAEQAVADLFRRQRLLVEGASACAFAAARRLADEGRHARVVAILTGANIDEAVLLDILARRPGA